MTTRGPWQPSDSVTLYAAMLVAVVALGALFVVSNRCTARLRRRRWRELSDVGVVAEATVTNKLRIGASWETAAHALEVTFEYGPANWMRAAITVPEPVYEALSVGDVTAIRYNPGQPTYARFEEHESLPPPARVRPSWPALAFGVLACLCVWIAPGAWVAVSDCCGWSPAAPVWLRAASNLSFDLLVPLLLVVQYVASLPAALVRSRGLTAVATILERREADWPDRLRPAPCSGWLLARWAAADGTEHESGAAATAALEAFVVGQACPIRYVPPGRPHRRVLWAPEPERAIPAMTARALAAVLAGITAAIWFDALLGGPRA